MGALSMLYGGFRTGNLIENGNKEKRILEAAAGAYYQTRFFTYSDGNGWTGTFRNTTWKVHAGTYSTEFNIASTVYTPSTYPWASMLQSIPLDEGLQSAQMRLLHYFQAYVYLESGLGCNVEARVDIGIMRADDSVEYRLSIPLGLLSTDVWLNLSQWFTPGDYWIESSMRQATDLVVRLYLKATGTSSGPVRLAVDDFHLGAEMEFEKQISFPEDIERDRDGKTVRLGDSSRTLLQTFQAKGRSKRAGALHFRLISPAQKRETEGIWAYAGQNYVWWIPQLTGYSNIAIRPRGKFRFVVANPNLLSGYSGDLTWNEY